MFVCFLLWKTGPKIDFKSKKSVSGKDFLHHSKSGFHKMYFYLEEGRRGGRGGGKNINSGVNFYGQASVFPGTFGENIFSPTILGCIQRI